MESVCFCCHPEKEEDSQDSQRQRLIGESKSEPQYGTTSSDRYSVISKEPKSARQHRPTTHGRDYDQSVESLDEAAEIKLKEIPIQSIHKRFQDQTNLYNDVLDNYKSLRSAVHSFKELFEKDTGGIPVWGDCMKILRQRCGNTEIEVIRRKHSVELKYDDKDLSRNTDLSIDSIIPALELFNRINKLIRNSLERCPHVHSGLKMLLAEESSVKKEIAKIDLSGEIGPEALKACIEDVKLLRSTPDNVEGIRNYSDKLFKEIVFSTQVMIQ